MQSPRGRPMLNVMHNQGHDDLPVVAVDGGLRPAPARDAFADEETAQRLVQDVVRRLLRITSPDEAVSELVGLVHALGGWTVPARLQDDRVLPVDLSMGVLPEPLLAAADPGSAARRHLQAHLPGLIEDVRAVVARLDYANQSARDATVDPLTGLLNRRGAGRLLPQGSAGDVVVMVDLDHFKELNDTQGHDVGDQVLRRFGQCLRATLREADIACRFGGEEFLLVLPSTEAAHASSILQRLRERWLADSPLHVTFSAGVAPVGTDGFAGAIQAADAALYRAKQNGRDRVEITEEDRP